MIKKNTHRFNVHITVVLAGSSVPLSSLVITCDYECVVMVTSEVLPVSSDLKTENETEIDTGE